MPKLLGRQMTDRLRRAARAVVAAWDDLHAAEARAREMASMPDGYIAPELDRLHEASACLAGLLDETGFQVISLSDDGRRVIRVTADYWDQFERPGAGDRFIVTSLSDELVIVDPPPDWVVN